MDTKLEEYRLRKRKAQVSKNWKEKFLKLMPFQQVNTKENTEIDIPQNDNDNSDNNKVTNKQLFSNEINSNNKLEATSLKEEPPKVLLIQPFDDNEENENDDKFPPENRFIKYSLWIVYFLFWATCYAIAIELKFGIVYLMLSALFGIYFNTRTRPRKQGELSAYSVFNKNCISIDGTLKAEQFEQEIRYGPASVR